MTNKRRVLLRVRILLAFIACLLLHVPSSHGVVLKERESDDPNKMRGASNIVRGADDKKDEGPAYAPGEILVGFKEDVDPEKRLKGE